MISPNPVRGLSGRLRSSWELLITSRTAFIPATVLLANLILVVFVNRVVLQDYANISDEYVYRLMAQMFAEGSLSVPSPEPREFFNFMHVLNDGRFCGKYPPGWPSLLAIGFWIGLPWLVNPLVTMATLVLLYRIALKHFSAEAANFLLLSTLANPFILFLSASYYSHPACLLFLTCFLGAYLDSWVSPDGYRAYVLMGVGAGLAFLVRPYTAVAAVAPLAIVRVRENLKAGHPPANLGRLGLAAGVFGLFVAVLLWYNYEITGNPLLQPFSKYDPHDHPRLDLTWVEWKETLKLNLGSRLLELNTSLPLSLFFLFLYLFMRETRLNKKGSVLILMGASQFIAYFFYRFHGMILHGPHYVYECTAGLLLISGVVMAALPRFGPGLLIVVIALNVANFAGSTRYHMKFVEDSRAVFLAVQRERLTNAIVFLRTGCGPMGFPHEYTRNGIHFDGPVLYVLDEGAGNIRLLQKYPRRTAYTWEFDTSSNSGRLRPYSP
jgi:hypothetical protein